MKGAICGLFASTLLLTIAPSPDAWAAGQRVVVEKFSGPGTIRYRSMVLAVLSQRSATVVDIEKVTATEADLGLLNVSDNYSAVAKELKVNAFIGGTIAGKGRKVSARLKGVGADGKLLGQATWTARNLAMLYKAMGATLSKKIGAMLSGAGSSGGRGGEGAAAEAAAEPAASSKAATASVEQDEPRSKKSRASDDDSPPPRKKARDDEESVSASADLEEGPRAAHPKIDFTFGVHAYRRDFSYNDNLKGSQQAYKLPGVPAPTLSLDYFFLPAFGATLGGEYSMALISQDGAGNKYKTSSYGYFIGGKARHFFSGGTELQGVLAYALNGFKIVPAADDMMPPQVAGVLYEQARVGGSMRVPLTEKVSLIGGGNYLHVLTMGPIKKDYFNNATAHGGEAFGGLAFVLPWMKGLEGRVTADLRRYVFSMNPGKTDDRIAGGAVDQYLGLNLNVAYRN